MRLSPVSACARPRPRSGTAQLTGKAGGTRVTGTVRAIAAVALLCAACSGRTAPTTYTDRTAFLAALSALGHAVIHESFEDGATWADSRNSIVAPGSAPSVTSQGIRWTSNYFPQNRVATGDVGGSAPDGTYAIYSLPHGMTTDSGLYCDSAEDPDIPVECFQNDGLSIESDSGGTLYAFGGRIDTANSGKVTFLLDGIDINANDSDNIDNWQREGEPADNWAFVGVVDPEGFQRAELRELRGKDYQQVLMFCDDFIIAAVQPVFRVSPWRYAIPLNSGKVNGGR